MKKACFISIPKNASKSVVEILGLPPGYELAVRNHIIHENHMPLDYMVDRCPKNTFFFAFVRNPYNRLRSWFNYHKDLTFYSGHTLDTWAEDGFPHHWDTWENWTFGDPLVQSTFLQGPVSFIGRVTNFDFDMKNVCRVLSYILGRRFNYTPVKLNESCVTEISPQTRELIYRHCREDFERFGYDRLIH